MGRGSASDADETELPLSLAPASLGVELLPGGPHVVRITEVEILPDATLCARLFLDRPVALIPEEPGFFVNTLQLVSRPFPAGTYITTQVAGPGPLVQGLSWKNACTEAGPCAHDPCWNRLLYAALAEYAPDLVAAARSRSRLHFVHAGELRVENPDLTVSLLAVGDDAWLLRTWEPALADKPMDCICVEGACTTHDGKFSPLLSQPCYARALIPALTPLVRPLLLPEPTPAIWAYTSYAAALVPYGLVPAEVLASQTWEKILTEVSRTEGVVCAVALDDPHLPVRRPEPIRAMGWVRHSGNNGLIASLNLLTGSIDQPARYTLVHAHSRADGTLGYACAPCIRRAWAAGIISNEGDPLARELNPIPCAAHPALSALLTRLGPQLEPMMQKLRVRTTS